ncbi:MAG TPA: hypothetical protein VEX88_02525 [Glaciibacter sp.]|nr:hypothetical protein [Glaciibacter sp.]
MDISSVTPVVATFSPDPLDDAQRDLLNWPPGTRSEVAERQLTPRRDPPAGAHP